jgi:SAM-dependent methyltransferase
MKALQACPTCGSTALVPFYTVTNVPVHSVLMMATRQEAVGYPQGDIHLAACRHCGFITNTTFDGREQEYSAPYEGTQSYSPTFNAFHKRLAEGLIERYDLHNKEIIEIGCGQGEFLILLCELGQNRGIGFDPAYDNRRPVGMQSDRVTFIADFYSEEYTRYHADFVCCKMTLEHISDTAEFVNRVRRSIGDRLETTVFFQVPNARYVLGDLAFWDVYYEHCSYFDANTLTYLFERCGFQVLDTYTEYDDQYLVIEAKPVHGQPSVSHFSPAAVTDLLQEVEHFRIQCAAQLAHWDGLLTEMAAADKRVVIWGGGSKGVAFLTALQRNAVIRYAVDINPNKHGTYMAGTGHEIVGPQTLATVQPDVVIVMNPIYCEEIRQDLARIGVQAVLLAIDEDFSQGASLPKAGAAMPVFAAA